MVLDPTLLKADLQDILDGPVTVATAVAAGIAWGDTINDYHTQGVGAVVENPAVTLIPVAIPASSLTAMKAALAVAFVDGTASGAAGKVHAALDTYWGTGVVTGAGPAVLAGSPTLLTDLTTIFSFTGGTHASKATDLRDALDAYATAITYAFIGPAPPAGTFNVQ